MTDNTQDAALVERADFITEVGRSLPADFPNYADWSITLPAGHWRALIAAERRLAEQTTANCCQCGRIIDTREVSEGGDDFGCQVEGGKWTCSPKCYDKETGLAEQRQAQGEVFGDGYCTDCDNRTVIRDGRCSCGSGRVIVDATPPSPEPDAELVKAGEDFLSAVESVSGKVNYRARDVFRYALARHRKQGGE